MPDLIGRLRGIDGVGQVYLDVVILQQLFTASLSLPSHLVSLLAAVDVGCEISIYPTSSCDS